jgi:hypothetical protein
MKSLCAYFGLGLIVVALASAPSFAQMPAYTGFGPVPSSVAAAKTIFVSNAGADSGLFPEPFSGDQDRAYTEFYAALKAAGDYSLVQNPSQADLVLELRLTAPNGPTNPSKQNGASDPLPMFRLTIYDAKTHYVLWAITSSIDFAFLQKTHDRNFDEALSAVLARFLQIAGRSGAQTHP